LQLHNLKQKEWTSKPCSIYN